jgi:hypothetical protein
MPPAITTDDFLLEVAVEAGLVTAEPGGTGKD